MKKELYISGEYCRLIGKPVFKDSLGKQLCVGDVVLAIGGSMYYSINLVADSYIYGWASSTQKGDLTSVFVYKLINYTQVEKLENKIKIALGNTFEIKKKIRKLTMAELEEIVGEPFEIVKEEE